jgi:hypothetical protein
MNRLRSLTAALLVLLITSATLLDAQATMPIPPSFSRVPVHADDPDFRALTQAIRRIEQRLSGNAPIADADGTLADLTSKFNQLLAHMRAARFIPTS